jgi:MerR HTH family regulatory protein
MREHYLLGEVSRVLGRKPHVVTHLLTSGKIPEPQVRIANKRLFTVEDVERLARHLRVALDWSAVNAAPVDAEAVKPERLTLRPPFEVISVGETGHEIRDGNGELFAWTPDRGHALVVAGLLEAAARG